LVNITHHLASLRGMAWTRGEQKLPSALFHPQNQPKSKGDTTKPARPNRQAKRSSSSSNSAPTVRARPSCTPHLCFSSEPHPSSGNFHHAPALSLVPRCALPIHTTRSRNPLIRRTTSNKLFSPETLKSALCYPILSYPVTLSLLTHMYLLCVATQDASRKSQPPAPQPKPTHKPTNSQHKARGEPASDVL